MLLGFLCGAWVGGGGSLWTTRMCDSHRRGGRQVSVAGLLADSSFKGLDCSMQQSWTAPPPPPPPVVAGLSGLC